MNKFVLIFGVVVAILLGVILTMNSLMAVTSPISYAIKYIGLGLALVAFVKPQHGIYIIVGEAFFVDYLKKVAVFYGNVSIMTIIEVLIVVMLALVACIAGLFTSGRVRFNFKEPRDRAAILFVVGGVILSMLLIFSNRDVGIISAFQIGFNAGAYMGLVSICIVVCRDEESFRSLLLFALVCSFISALMAVSQSYLGFSKLDDYYMYTGLSPVASGQYLLDIERGRDPRVFGLASGCQNFAGNVGGIALALGVLALRPKALAKGFCWLAIAVLAVSIFLSRMKTGIILVGACPLAFIFFRNRVFLVTSYVSFIVFMGYLFINATTIRSNIGEYDAALRGFFNLPADYSIQTFEARLSGYSYWSDKKNFTYFGNRDGPEAHDMLTTIYIEYGAVSVFLLLVGGLFIVYTIHRIPFLLEKGVDRNLYLAGLSFFATGFAANIFGGSNIHSTPWNVLLWLSASMCVYAAINGKRIPRNRYGGSSAPAPASEEVDDIPRLA